MAKEKVKEEIDLTTIKEELTDYINLEIKKSFNEETTKAYNKLIREKNKKIFFKNIVILLLLIIIGGLLYLLYENRFFDKYVTKEVIINKEVDNKPPKEDTTLEPEKEDNKPSLEDLKEGYSYLLDNITINEKSTYLKDYYNGELSNELKLYLALNTANFDKFTKEDDNTIIEEKTLKEAYNNLFNDEFTNISFNYNGKKIQYFSKLNSYLSDSLLEYDKTNIVREIKDIKVDDKIVKIITVEGIIKDKKLYNIISNNEIKKYKNDSLLKYEDKLNLVVYTFNDEYLESIQ